MINILYEDNHIIVVEKPVNVPVQKDNSNDMDLLTMIKEYIKIKYNKPGEVYLGLIHRLDRPTGGLMVFAKTSKAASRLSEDMRKRLIDKTYYAVVNGNPLESDTLVDYLLKDEKENMSKVVDELHGKKAILHYTKIKTVGNLSLVRINLETGRSHQIRVQFASRKMPLVGDMKYNVHGKKTQLALYAVELSFIHPTLKEKMDFKISPPNSYPWDIF